VLDPSAPSENPHVAMMDKEQNVFHSIMNTTLQTNLQALGAAVARLLIQGQKIQATGFSLDYV
jgi:hypothetical protein